MMIRPRQKNLLHWFTSCLRHVDEISAAIRYAPDPDEALKQMADEDRHGSAVTSWVPQKPPPEPLTESEILRKEQSNLQFREGMVGTRYYENNPEAEQELHRLRLKLSGR
jgi:hypothetical protein